MNEWKVHEGMEVEVTHSITDAEFSEGALHAHDI